MSQTWQNLSKKQQKKFGSKKDFKNAKKEVRSTGASITSAKQVVKAHKAQSAPAPTPTPAPAPTPTPAPRPSPTPTPAPTPASTYAAAASSSTSGYEQRIQELQGRGMSRDQAVSHNQSAIDQGMDLNGDGYATDSEYLKWQENRPAPTATSSSQQEAQERAQNYSQMQADAASAKQQYDQSINEWETAFNERDQQYSDDVNKMDEEYQKQFEEFEKATALSMMKQGSSQATYSKVKDNLLNQTDSYNKFNSFGNFDASSEHQRREYSFNK